MLLPKFLQLATSCRRSLDTPVIRRGCLAGLVHRAEHAICHASDTTRTALWGYVNFLEGRRKQASCEVVMVHGGERMVRRKATAAMNAPQCSLHPNLGSQPLHPSTNSHPTTPAYAHTPCSPLWSSQNCILHWDTSSTVPSACSDGKPLQPTTNVVPSV